MTDGVLALVGGAEWSPGCASFDEELLALSGGTEVVIVPTAAAYENPSALIDRARCYFDALGATVRVIDVYRRAEALDEGHLTALADARFVYVSGGSPMHLRSVLKDTSLLEALVGAFTRGAVVAAAGEGAAVLCSYMADTRGGAFTVGLDLVTGFTVLPRYNRWSEDTLHRTVRLAPADLPVVGIDECTALIHRPDGVWETRGEGRVSVFVGGRAVGLEALPVDLRT